MSALVRGGREVEAATRAAGRCEMDEPVRIAAAARRRTVVTPGSRITSRVSTAKRRGASTTRGYVDELPCTDEG